MREAECGSGAEITDTVEGDLPEIQSKLTTEERRKGD